MTNKPETLEQIGDDVLGDSVTEIFLLQIAAHVREWEDHNRGPVRERRGDGGRTRLRRADRHAGCSKLIFESGSQCWHRLARVRRCRLGTRRPGYGLLLTHPAAQHIRCHNEDADRDDHRTDIEPRGPHQPGLRHLDIAECRCKPMLGAESG